MRRALFLAIAATTAVLGVAPMAAGAANEPKLSDSAARFPDRVYALTLPDERQLAAGDVEVTENGRPVNNLAVANPGEAGSTTILAIDASNSMRGKPIQDAMAAARAFVDRRNPNSPLGVVFFNEGTTVALAPTRDRGEIDAALAEPPHLREKTHLFDGIAAAADEIRRANAPAGTVVVLSDGADVGSGATQESAIESLRDANARAFTVGLKSESYDPGALQAIASETGGVHAEASNSSRLQAIFSQIGSRLSNEYLLLWRSLQGPEQKVKVAVSVDGYPQTLKTTYTTPALGLTLEPFSKSFFDRLLQSWAFMLLVVVAIVALLVWAVRTVVESRNRGLRSRLAMFVDVGGQGPSDGTLSREELAARIGRVERSLESSGYMQRFAEQCEIGRVDAPPALLLFGSIAGGLVLGVLLAALLGPLAFFIGAVIPAAAVSGVKTRASRQQKAFGEQLPDNLEVLAGSLRAGHSLVGGLSVMAEDANEPSRTEFRRVVTDEQLGVPLDEALKRIGTRMNNRDMDQVALIALLQRETGGSSAEVIDQVSENIRGRLEVRRLVRVLTAQGRLARWVVSLMPIALVLMILAIYPEYLDPLFHTTVGAVALIFSAMLVLAGSLVIKRIVEIKV